MSTVDPGLGSLLPCLTATLPGIVRFLQTSESLVIQDLARGGVWPVPAASPPPPCEAGEHVFGLIPYWLNYEFDTLNGLLKSVPLAEPFATQASSLIGLLQSRVPARITPEVYQSLRRRCEAEGGLVGADGTIYGFDQFR